MDKEHFSQVNQEYWDKRVPHHLGSDFYDQKSFLEGRSSLNPYEVALLGELKGKKIIHFQCHFGQDTLSMARLGAKTTGIDLSPLAVQKANELAAFLELDAHFIQSNVLEVDQVVKEVYDIVFTSYGTICWLPDLKEWAAQVAARLNKGGKLVMVDFHPVVYMMDDLTMNSIEHSYFNKGLIEGTEFGSYADNDAAIEATYHTWNHSMSELWKALNSAGLRLDVFEEYEHSPYPCFPNMVETDHGYQIKGLEGKLPMLYGLVAIKD